MISYTASSELDPEGMFPQTDSLFEASGSNLPTPLTGWDVLPPPPTSSVAWWGRGRTSGRRSGQSYPSPLTAVRFPFRIG